MSSKRKRRYEAWLEREKKRAEKRFSWQRFQKAQESGNIERMAEELGIRLK